LWYIQWTVRPESEVEGCVKETDLDRVDRIESADPGGMLRLVEGFSDQCGQAVEVGQKARLPETRAFRNIVVAGMGGSAIGGDLLGRCFEKDLRQPWFVNRNYSLPAWVDARTLLLVVSYSGNTEETLQAFEEGVSRGATIVCLTSGGSLSAEAEKRDLPLIRIPGGLPPRAALGYSFFPLAVVLGRLELVSLTDADLAEALETIRSAGDCWGRSAPGSENSAKALAGALVGCLPVLYAGDGLLSPVATRWKGQFNENSKSLAYMNVFPEVTHNEIEGWEGAAGLGVRSHVVFLRDIDDSPRIQRRMEVTAGIIGNRAGHITELWSEGKGRMARMFSLVCLGDFVSVYLALLSGRDPTPVDNINRLKEALADLPR